VVSTGKRQVNDIDVLQSDDIELQSYVQGILEEKQCHRKVEGMLGLLITP